MDICVDVCCVCVEVSVGIRVYMRKCIIKYTIKLLINSIDLL